MAEKTAEQLRAEAPPIIEEMISIGEGISGALGSVVGATAPKKDPKKLRKYKSLIPKEKRIEKREARAMAAEDAKAAPPKGYESDEGRLGSELLQYGGDLTFDEGGGVYEEGLVEGEAGETLVDTATKLGNASDALTIAELDVPEETKQLWYKEWGLTPESTILDMQNASEQSSKLDLTRYTAPSGPHDYATDISNLEGQITDVDKEIAKFEKDELALNEAISKETQSREAAANVYRLSQVETIQEAEKEKLVADQAVEVELKLVSDMMDKYDDPYLTAISDEFKTSMKGPPSGGLAKVLGHEGQGGLGPWGLFDKNGFSWAGTAQTLLWGIGVLANTALSVGAAASGKGNVPNYLLDAMFKAFEHDFDEREKWWAERKKTTDAAVGGLDQLTRWATEKADKKTAWRNAVYTRVAEQVAGIKNDPQYREISKNPAFRVAIDELQGKFIQSGKAAKLAHYRAKKVDILATVKARKGIMAAASTAQTQQMSASYSRTQIVKAINESKTDPITKLNIDDQRYWGAAFEQHQRILQAKSLIQMIIEREGGEGHANLKDIILAKTQLGKVLGDEGAFLIQELHDLGEIIGRYQARKLDVGNLNKEEQKFGQEKSFLAEQNIAWILKTIEVYEHQNITGLLARRARTSPELRHHLDITLQSMGITNPDEITKSMITGDFNPDSAAHLGHYAPANFIKNWRTKYQKSMGSN